MSAEETRKGFLSAKLDQYDPSVKGCEENTSKLEYLSMGLDSIPSLFNPPHLRHPSDTPSLCNRQHPLLQPLYYLDAKLVK